MYVSELTYYFVSGRKILERSSFLLPTTRNSKSDGVFCNNKSVLMY